MQRTIAIKLDTTPNQDAALARLAAAFAHGCTIAAGIAAEHRCTNRVQLHHRAYYPVREQTRLGAQMACNAMRAVASAYKTLKSNKQLPAHGPFSAIEFRRDGAVHFDKRTYAIQGEQFSLYTLDGRIHVPMRTGRFQREYLDRGTPREAKLVHKKGAWYFHLVLALEPGPARGTGVLAIDLGENNIAATHTGRVFGGGQLRDDRDRFLALRRRLQRNGSASAKQRLREASGRERRHMTHVNHEVSRAIVAEALACGAGVIAMERLTHIRQRIRSGKRVRTRLHRWAWAQLQRFVEYKAEAEGLVVAFVNPAYSSRTCAHCGQLAKRQRDTLSCTCGNRAHADVNAASNLAWLAGTAVSARGAVSRPDVAVA